MNDEEQDRELEKLYATIGRFVLIFQGLETKVGECLLLLWGYENWTASHGRLAQMTNKAKVDALWKAFQEAPSNARGRERKDWVHHFKSLIARLHAVRRTRNRLLHSHYLYDFMKIGEPVLQVDPKHGNSFIDAKAQEAIIAEAASVGFDLNFAHVQLIHDHVSGTGEVGPERKPLGQ